MKIDMRDCRNNRRKKYGTDGALVSEIGVLQL